MNMKKIIVPSLLMFAMATPVAAFDRPIYFGLGAGVSMLSPDVTDTDYTLDKKTSMAISATLGMRFTDRINGELAYTQLGEAALSSDEEIGYAATSVGLLAYVLGNESPQPGRSRLRGYVRLGLNKIDNEYDILVTKENSTALWAGAGLEWPLGSRFKLRGELASFDGDAQALTVGLLYKLGSDIARRPQVEPVQPAQAPKTELPKTPEVTAPEVTTPAVKPKIEQPPEATELAAEPKIVQPTVEPTPKPQPQTPAKPEVQAPVEVAELPEAEPVQPSRIAPPSSGVLRGVDFEPGTATLTPIARQILTRYAASMQAYPASTIEIAAHTDGDKGSAEKLALTRNRAIAVARHLAANGVVVSRMKARAFGANKPRASGESAGAMRLNNRIEIFVR